MGYNITATYKNILGHAVDRFGQQNNVHVF